MKFPAQGVLGARSDADRNRLLLPLASFLNDFGWELPVMLIPLFIVNILGASAVAVGVVAGVAEATSSATKVLSGVLSDRTGRRKRLTESGYLVATLARTFLVLVTSWPGALVSRFVDQIGKGLRTSARDALLADSTPPAETGKAFGLLRGMDSLGAAASMLVGLGIIFVMQGNSLVLRAGTFKVLIALGTVLGFSAFFVVLFLVREIPTRTRTSLDLEPKAGLPRIFLAFTAVSFLFSLGDSSDAFLILRSQSLGGTTLLVVGLIGGFNLIYAFGAQYLGRLSDRVGKRRLMIIGWTLYVLSYAGFAAANQLVVLGLVLIPYGVYYALTEGIGRAMVADLVPSHSRGAAYGIYHGGLGLSSLLASVIAGVLYSRVSPASAFYFGAALAALATVLLLLVPVGGRPRAEARAA